MGNVSDNGFWKYVMSGIMLVLVIGSFAWTTAVYKDVNTKFDNHLMHLESKFDDRISKVYDKVMEIRDDTSNIKERVSVIEAKLNK